jgi:L-aspartate oxidase
LRDAEGLRAAIAALAPLAASHGASGDPAAVALMIAVAALRRQESRGAHFRTDHPAKSGEPMRSQLTLDEAFAVAQQIAPRGLTREGLIR